jgi:CcmD family protein
MVYLFAAFFVLWAITFGYLYVLGGRQQQLEQQLAALRARRAAPAELPRDLAAPSEGPPER